MAFTSVIKPYRFVNPSSISTRGGATIIAGGKRITGNNASPSVKSARVTLLSINRIGMAMEGLGKTQQQIRDIIVYENKYLTNIQKFNRTRDSYRKDQKSEAQSESFDKKQQEEVSKEVVKKQKDKLSWLEKLFKPFEGIISFVGRFIITQTVLRWMGDSKNTDKLVVFVKSIGTVFKWAYNIAYKSTDAVLSGFAKVFGSSDKKGLDRFGEVLGGLGQLLIGIAGFKALGYLLNPFSLVNDIMDLIDALGSGGGGSGGGGGGGGGGVPEKPQLGRGAQKVAEGYGDDAARYYEDLVKRGKKPGDALKAVRGRFRKLPPPPKTLAGKLKQGFSNKWEDLKFMAKAGFAGVKKFGMKAIDFGKGVFAKGAEFAKNVGGWLKAAPGEIKKLAAVAKDPDALKMLANKMVAEKVKPAIEKNPIVKKLVGIASDPKNLKRNVGELIKDASKSKQARDLVKYLDEVKGKAKIGGLDKIIAIVSALLDYGAFGTPMANAFLGAIGGLLGYTGGFALGAPFGGVTGFITGTAGGFAGEFIGRQLAHLLAKTALGKTRDPFMKDGRMLADPELAEGGITTKPTRAWIGESGPEVVLPLSKFSGGGAIASTLIGATQSALSRMGSAGEIAKGLINPELQAAMEAFGVSPTKGSGGDTLGKSVNKGSIAGLNIDAGDDISIYLGKDNVVISDKKEPRNKPTTLRGQLANVLSALIWVSNKEFSSGSAGGGGGGGGGSNPPGNIDLKGNSNAEKVFNYLVKNEGFTPEAAAGVIGNLMQESSVNPKQTQIGGGPGRGIMQWSEGERWASMKAWAGNKDPWALDTQVQWMVKEMKDYGTYNRVKGVKDYKKAVEIFESEMERAGTPNYPRRYAYAASAYSTFAGTKKAAAGGVIPPGIKDSSISQLKKSEENKLKILKGEMIGGLVKFANGGTFKNGQLPASALEDVGKGNKLRKGDAASSFLQMAAAAKKDNIDLVSAITGSYRDLAGQEYMYATKPKGMAAKPGTSKHGWGVALDIGYANAQNWINKNGGKFGWGLPNWAKGGFEPWHFEKLGAATGANSPTDSSSPTTTPTQEQEVDPFKALEDALGKAQTALGYSSPEDSGGKTKPPSKPAPSKPVTSPTPASSSNPVGYSSGQVADLKSVAEMAEASSGILPMPIPINMNSGPATFAPSTEVFYGKPIITVAI